MPSPPGLTDHSLLTQDNVDALVNDVASFEAQSATATQENVLPILKSSFALVAKAGRSIASLVNKVMTVDVDLSALHARADATDNELKQAFSKLDQDTQFMKSTLEDKAGKVDNKLTYLGQISQQQQDAMQ